MPGEWSQLRIRLGVVRGFGFQPQIARKNTAAGSHSHLKSTLSRKDLALNFDRPPAHCLDNPRILARAVLESAADFDAGVVQW